MKTIEDSREAVATSREETSSSESLEGLAAQVRILAPQPVINELTSLLSKQGFSLTGTEPEKGHEDRVRAYMVRPVKKVEAPTIPEPIPPTQPKELLESQKKQVQAELLKLQHDEATAIIGADPDALVKIRERQNALTAIGQHVGFQLEKWGKYDEEIKKFAQAKKTMSQIDHFRYFKYYLDDAGHRLEFSGLTNSRGLSLDLDRSLEWMAAPDFVYLIRLSCRRCGEFHLKTPQQLLELEKSQKDGETK